MASLMIVHNDENGTQASCGTVDGENDITYIRVNDMEPWLVC